MRKDCHTVIQILQFLITAEILSNVSCFYKHIQYSGWEIWRYSQQKPFNIFCNGFCDVKSCLPSFYILIVPINNFCPWPRDQSDTSQTGQLVMKWKHKHWFNHSYKLLHLEIMSHGIESILKKTYRRKAEFLPFSVVSTNWYTSFYENGSI